MWSSPRGPTRFQSSRPCCRMTPACTRFMPAGTGSRASFRAEPCWSWAPGHSGAQIAEELMRAGRRVYLSVGRHRRMPRRYRGRDLTWWLTAMGLDRTPVEKRGPDKTLPLITGAYGGHTIDFRRLRGAGSGPAGPAGVDVGRHPSLCPRSGRQPAIRGCRLHGLPRSRGWLRDAARAGRSGRRQAPASMQSRPCLRGGPCPPSGTATPPALAP